MNARGDTQWTPLHWAAVNGHEAAVRLLLAAGAGVYARTDTQWTPLHWAALNGHEAAVQALLAAGADANARTDTQATPLHLAAQNGHEAAARALLAAGAGVNARTDTQATPLHSAVVSASTPVVKCSSNLELMWTQLIRWVPKPCRIALMLQREEIAELLVAHGADRARAERAGDAAGEAVVAMTEMPDATSLGLTEADVEAALEAGKEAFLNSTPLNFDLFAETAEAALIARGAPGTAAKEYANNFVAAIKAAAMKAASPPVSGTDIGSETLVHDRRRQPGRGAQSRCAFCANRL